MTFTLGLVAARKNYHHGDLKRALVEVSIELIEAEGLDALSVVEAGRRLGVSVAAPYRHFKDRNALLRAIAAEGNRMINEAITQEVATQNDPAKAFALSGVAYVEWAAHHPELYRATFDPNHIEFAAAPESGELNPPEVLEKMASFWPNLSSLISSKKTLSPDNPTIQELSGRALGHGLASMFVSGVFRSLGIEAKDARRIARAAMGLDVEPATAAKIAKSKTVAKAAASKSIKSKAAKVKAVAYKSTTTKRAKA